MNTKLFSFDGRSKRSGYWGVSFGTFFVLVVVMTVLDALFPGVGEEPSKLSLVIFMILLIPYCWINLAVQIRRWHDLELFSMHFSLELARNLLNCHSSYF